MIGKIKLKWKMPPLNYGIYSESELSVLIKRERNRADRNDSYFSVVLFKLKPAESKHNIKRLISSFKENIREIDYIGWYEGRTIGVILPVTDFNGAGHFVSHINNLIEKFSSETQIISYPEDNDRRKIQASEELIEDFSTSIPFWKTSLDKIGSLAGFIFFSPFFLLLPFYIKIVSPGPVFYSQTRIGYKGKEFKFWKFRTMHIGGGTGSHNNHLKTLINSDLPMTKLDDKNDPRIIPGGRILRKCCIDEIPQIFNILRGEMSLVGPRPCIPYEAEEYLHWHKYRFDINPGLTGLWQVSGKNSLTFKEMIRLDITYARNMSLLLDLRIILATIPAIFKMILESVYRHMSSSEIRENQQKIQRRNV